jgi:putative RecB family exonuclease
MTTITNTHSGIDHLSYSAVSTFQRCPLKWHFRYVDKLPDESIGSALAFGSAIHAGLERHFQQLLETGKRPGIGELLLAYDDCWQSYDARLLTFGRGEDADSLRELGEKMFTAFQEHDFSSTDGTIVAIEEPLRAEFIPGMPDLVARVDLAVQTGDELVVTDFKTSRSRWNPGQVDLQAEQLLLYSDLARKVLGDRKIRLQFAVITKAKTPVVELHEVELNEARLDRTRAVFSQVWDAIQSGIVYPAPSQMNCWGCGYKKACQQWQA